jgi:palmitoyltransferase
MAPGYAGAASKGIQMLAIPAVCALMCFLAYDSQWLFHFALDLEPGRPSTAETVIFNILLLCLWWSYFKACTVDPGRYARPSSSSPNATSPSQNALRYCKKCRAPKPPRAHHCRHCGRCIPKMDHHCPWTSNCVSMTTFPYFYRFLVYANLSLWFLGYLLYQRFAALWASRHLPAYLGPSLKELVNLTLLGLFCAATSLALGIMLATTAKGWIANRTMIEGWEAERWEAVVERYGEAGESWWNENEDTNPWEDIEFPYDIGLFANMTQAMGTSNVLLWFMPFAGGPVIAKDRKGTGWSWPENGFNARDGMWPPPDPDKLRRAARSRDGWPGAEARLRAEENVISSETSLNRHEAKLAFLRRQDEDLRRRKSQRRQRAADELIDDELFDVERDDEDGDIYDEMLDEGMDGKPGWTNMDGDRLRDYGVDEDVEAEELVPIDRDDDVPLAELIRKRKPRNTVEDR